MSAEVPERTAGAERRSWIRWLGFGAVAGMAIGIGAMLAQRELDYRDALAREQAAERAAPAIGGPFALVDQAGRKVTDADFRGRPLMLLFGFTSCPDICPTALALVASVLEALGPAADRIQPLFVSVDPERDTPERLAAYTSSFDPRILGLTGTAEQIRDVTREYGVYYRKVPTEGTEYTMDHSAIIYLIGADGRLRATLDPLEDPAAGAAKAARLLDRRGGGPA